MATEETDQKNIPSENPESKDDQEKKPSTWKQYTEKAWSFTKKNWYWIVVPTAAIPVIIIFKKIMKKKK